MDDLLNDVKSLHFPLTQMCLTKLAINTCKHQEIASFNPTDAFSKTLEERERYRQSQAWKRIERLSVDVISDLMIPEKFKFRIFHTVWPTCMEIKLVTRHYFKFLFCGPPLINTDLQNKLEWTSYGTVDLVRSAKVFVREELIDVNQRYRLACYYCFKDDFPEIWAGVDEDDKYWLDSICGSYEERLIDPLTHYWTCYEKEGSKCLERFSYKDLFICAFNHRSIAAVKYFFAKLNIEQKEAIRFGESKFNP
ncbi:hypothetical protein CEXT_770671 [Caerostris extrusa]|uniref:Uncharacterized protein n=1 Tax=Caerostris extrusa TaxID=172846 RepID=A0AAV4NGA8_CAEEX|nr:hypothetical protein CEXT_770671 [Caerostris extrusa]